MSNSDRRLPLAEARDIAEELLALLSPVCQRVEIAGSIRREKPDIGDVEIVAIPTWRAQLVAADIFGDAPATEPVNLLDEFCAGLVLRDVFQKRLNKLGRAAWGTDLKWGTYRGFPIDIYSANTKTWGVTLAVRTGSAEFSHRLVTPRSQGGLCPSSLEVKGWRVRRRDTTELLSTPEEDDVFRALSIEWLPPKFRTDTAMPRRLELA